LVTIAVPLHDLWFDIDAILCVRRSLPPLPRIVTNDFGSKWTLPPPHAIDGAVN
jgi:hypothetical protein